MQKKQHTKNIVCLPGWLFKASIWQVAAQYVQSLTLIDYPCLASKAQNLQALTENMATQLPQNTILIGWSFGGLVALQLAALFPEKIKHLVLVCSTPRFVCGEKWSGICAEKQAQFYQTSKREPHIFMRHYLSLVAYPNKEITDTSLRTHLDDQNISSHRCYLKWLFESDLREAYQSLTLPITHVMGEKDAIVRWDPSELMALNANAVVHTIANTGHAPFLSHKRQFFEVLRQQVLTRYA